MVLAGGEGKRLMPLTADRAKPAVPFGGLYRMVDFALSNLVNGGYLKIVVLTQCRREVLHVNPGAAVDIGRKLAGQQIDTHGENSSRSFCDIRLARPDRAR